MIVKTSLGREIEVEHTDTGGCIGRVDGKIMAICGPEEEFDNCTACGDFYIKDVVKWDGNWAPLCYDCEKDN